MKSLAASANEQLIPIGQPLAYHYCSAATGLAIVEGQNIWASDYTKMNDPKELKYGVDAMRAVISQTSTNSNALQLEVWSTWERVLVSSMPHLAVMISSLSTLNDSLTLFRFYGDQARGCSIGINIVKVEEDVAKIDSYISGTHLMSYDADQLTLQQSRIVRLINAFLQKPGLMERVQRFDTTERYKFFRSVVVESAFGSLWNCVQYKSPDYSDEAEARISVVAPFRQLNTNSRLKYRNSSAGPIGYLELSLMTDRSKSAIEEIVLGPASSHNFMEKLSELLKRPYLQHIKVKKSQSSYRPL